MWNDLLLSQRVRGIWHVLDLYLRSCSMRCLGSKHPAARPSPWLEWLAMAAESGEKFALSQPTDVSNGPRPRRWPTDPIWCLLFIAQIGFFVARAAGT